MLRFQGLAHLFLFRLLFHVTMHCHLCPPDARWALTFVSETYIHMPASHNPHQSHDRPHDTASTREQHNSCCSLSPRFCLSSVDLSTATHKTLKARCHFQWTSVSNKQQNHSPTFSHSLLIRTVSINETESSTSSWLTTGCFSVSSFNFVWIHTNPIKCFQPEWYISTMIYSWDTPFPQIM